MNVKWKRTLLALMLAAAMLLSMPVGIAADGETPEDPASGETEASRSTSTDLDVDKDVTLTIEPSSSTVYKSDLGTNATFVYDIYKIAKAVKDDKYSTYSYEMCDDFTSLASTLKIGTHAELAQVDTAKWREYAGVAGK